MANDCDSDASSRLPQASEVDQAQKQQQKQEQSLSHLNYEVIQEASDNSSYNLPEELFGDGDKNDAVVPENPAKSEDVLQEEVVKSGGPGSLGGAGLVKSELRPVGEMNSVVVLSKREIGDSEVQESTEFCVKLEFPEKLRANGNCEEGAVKCALKIEIIDDTALVETSEIGRGILNPWEIAKNNKNRNVRQEVSRNKEKRPRRRGKGGKNKISMPVEKEKNIDLKMTHIAEKEGKKVYLRKELEALRHFEGLEMQKQKWVEVYCGLGPAVQKEYDGLVTFNHNNQMQHQNKHKNKKPIILNFNPQFPNEAPGLIFGEESSLNADHEIENTNLMDTASDLLNDGNCCPIEQEERTEDDESDEDYSSIQKPAFFVTGDPDFDSGPSEDGLEYLRRVRWEAAQIPKVKIAKVDRSKIKKEQTIYKPQIPDIAKCPAHLMPLREWEDAFLADFSQLRLALSHYEVSEGNNCSKRNLFSNVHQGEYSCKLFEGILLETSYKEKITDDIDQSMDSSIPASCDTQDNISVADENECLHSAGPPSAKPFQSETSSNYPTLSVILDMDSVARVSLLRKRVSLVETVSSLSWDDCLWLFALCAAVDFPNDSDTCAALRSLLRKCASLRAEKSELDDEVVMLNILATISGTYFGQSETEYISSYL